MTFKNMKPNLSHCSIPHRQNYLRRFSAAELEQQFTG